MSLSVIDELKLARGISVERARAIHAREKREEFAINRREKKQEEFTNKRLTFRNRYGPDRIVHKRPHPHPHPKTKYEERILHLRNTREGSKTGPFKEYFLSEEFRQPTIY